MHAVQLTSFKEITPRARVGGGSASWGYCTVAAPRLGAGIGRFMPSGNIVLMAVFRVTPSPLMAPGISALGGMFSVLPGNTRPEGRAFRIF